MANNQTPSESEKDRRQAEEWMRPPLTTEPTPVAESSVLAATLALGEHTEELTRAVIANRNERKALQITVVIVAVLFLINGVYGIYTLDRIEKIGAGNASILQGVISVTNPQAQQRSIDRADFRTQQTIYCVNNFIAHTTDPTASSWTSGAQRPIQNQ